MRLVPSLLRVLALVLPVSLVAQQPAPNRPAGGAPPGGDQPRAERPQQAEAPKPYSQVITDKATTDSGVFIIHQLGDKLFYEIRAPSSTSRFCWSFAIRPPRRARAMPERNTETGWCAGSASATGFCCAA